MNRSLGLPPALALHEIAAADVSRARPAGDAPPGARQPSGDEAPSTSPSRRDLGDGHDRRAGHDGRDRMAERMNDVVVRRIFTAGLDLQAALGLIEEHGTAGEHPTAMEHRAASKIWSASDELDRAIRDLRDILFEGDRE
jgi:hypothetical protein